MTARQLRIEGEMTIYRAAELKQMLLAAAEGAAGLALDLSAVTELDSAGVQLLAMVRNTLAGAGAELRLVAQSESVAATLALLNLERSFGAAGAGA